MFRTDQSVGMLKTIALIAGLAILLWSLGLPSLRFADAANLTLYSDTITDSAPSASADHDIEFTLSASSTAIVATDTIVITFDAGFSLANIGEEDIDILIDGTNKPAAEWSVATSGTVMTITIDSGSIQPASTTQILIGSNATNEGSPNSQIVNPSTEGSKEISIAADNGDTGTTHVVILSNVQVSATVDTVFTFSVAGTGPGVSVNGDVTTGSTTSTTIPFGTLSDGIATTTAHQLTVTTNASNGYVVTIQTDGALQSSTGADIDGFANGSDTNTPATWASAPLGEDVNDEDTWGHWGFTSDDTDTTRDPGDEFGSQEYAAPSTTPRVVMSHTGPANAALVGIGTTTVGYKVEISALQEAGNDYSAVLTYIATPTF